MNIDTFARLLLLLSAIPTAPNQVDTVALSQLLESQGFRVTRRTVQRDLEKLARRFPLICRDESKPFGWSWSTEHPLPLRFLGAMSCSGVHCPPPAPG